MMALNLLKNKAYILAGGFSLAILALAILVALPLFTSIQEASQNLSSIKNETAALAIQQAEIENFKKNYQEYKTNLEKIDGLFIDTQNPVGFITFLETAAGQSGLDAQISLQPRQAGQAQGTMAFQIHTTGAFQRVLQFVERLENGQYLVQIDGITVNGIQFQPGLKDYAPGQVDTTFSVQAFAKP